MQSSHPVHSVHRRAPPRSLKRRSISLSPPTALLCYHPAGPVGPRDLSRSLEALPAMKPLLYLAGLCLPALALGWLPGPSRRGEEGRVQVIRHHRTQGPALRQADLPRTPSWKRSPAASTGPKAPSGSKGRRLSALLRHPQQPHRQMAGRQGHSDVPQAERLQRQAQADLKEPGSNGLLLDSEGRLVLMRARRPPRRPPGEGRQDHDDAGRQVQGQAPQQPQRRRLQVERRPLLHRPALRPDRSRTRTASPAWNWISAASTACRRTAS